MEEMRYLVGTTLDGSSKNTPIPTAASINVRVCVDEANEDVGLKRLKLHVK